VASKLHPGEFDCYAKAEPDEPLFTLLARDQDAATVVKLWAFLRKQQIELGIRPESDRAQVSEAMRCATEMEIWHRAHRVRQQVAEIEFDDRGIPTTGQHARKDRNSTSGALD
jgi:hypothetical protein